MRLLVQIPTGTFTLLLASVMVVSSTTLSFVRRDFPSCVETCISNTNLSGCMAGDTACLCKNAGFADTTSNCIQVACPGSDLANADQIVVEICNEAGANSTTSASSSSAAATTPAMSSSALPVTGANAWMMVFVGSGLAALGL